MKKILATLIYLSVIICAANDFVQMEISPRNVFTGEMAQLVLRAESSMPPEIIQPPKVEGIRWMGSSTSIRSQSINGNLSVVAERSYSFIAEKEGSYTIPALTVRVNNRDTKTKPLTFNVKKATIQANSGSGKEINIDDVVFSRLYLPDDKKTYYVGEYIPLEIRVYCKADMKINLGYPEISTGTDNIIYKNYQDTNPEKPQFARPRRGIQEINDTEYYCYYFNTEIKAISAGKLDLKAKTMTTLSIPTERSRRMSNDPFFDDFFGSSYSYQTIRHTAQTGASVLDILPLPELPKDAKWLGLVGNWNIIPELSTTKTKVGTAITFTLKIYGNGDLDNLKAPELQIKEFRIYTPEVIKNQKKRSAEIRYTMIPVREGILPVAENFCFFNNESGKYDSIRFSEKVSVEAAAAIITGSNGPNVVDSAISKQDETEKPEHSLAGLMYLKRITDAEKIQNDYTFSWCLAFVILGILSVIICEMLAYFLRGTSVAAKRKTEAKKQKKTLLERLQKAQPEQVYDLAQDISEYTNNALDLSPGTSLNETAEWIRQKNPELAGELKNISAGAWAPGATVFSEERKEKLIRMLKKLVCLIFCCSCAFLSAEEWTQDDVIKAYDSGNFQRAKQWYVQKLEKNGMTPALLYNIGNCCYQEKEFAKALLCYEKAHLLAPRDPEINRNLELTRRELNLSVDTKLNSPADIPVYLRNQMTPGEWMIFASIGFFILLLAFGLRKFVNIRVTLPSAIIGGIMIIIGLSMTISLDRTTYAPDRAIILKEGIVLRTLPSETAAALNDETLKNAESVTIREQRNKWIRIKAGNAIGWVPADAVGQLNGSKFSVF